MTEAAGAPPLKRRDYAVALVFSAFERCGQTILLLVSSVFIARTIGPAAFGIASLAMSLALILETACERLFRDVIVQRRELNKRELGAALTGSVAASLALAAALAASSPLWADLFAMPDLRVFLPIASLSIVFAGSGGVLAAVLHRRLDFGRLARRTLIGATLGAAAGMSLAASGFGGISLIAQYAVQSFASLIAMVASTRDMPRPNLDWRSLLPLLKYALPMSAAESLWNGSFRIFVALAGYLGGAVLVAHLEISMRFVQAVRNLWQSIVGPVALSLFAANQHDLDGLRALYRRLTAMNCLVALPVFGGMIVIAPQFVGLALGEDWMPAAGAMQFLALAAGVSIMHQFVGITVNAIGRPAWNLPSASAGLIGSLAGLMLLGATSATSAAMAWCARLALAQPVGIYSAWRAARLRPLAELWSPTLPSLAATTVMVGATLALNRWLWSDWSLLAQLVMSVLSGVVVYVLLVAIIARSILADMWLLGAELRRKG